MTNQPIGVVGLGLLGRSIATCLLGHGMRVVGYARSEESHASARRTIQTGLEDMVAHAGFDESILSDWRDRFLPTDRYEAFADCPFVIESVIEDAEAKRAVFDSIEAVVKPSTVIASNTSALPISTLQSDRRHPDRFVGMHWAEPAHATRFLELIRGEQTSDATMQAVVRLVQAVGKDPSVVRKDVPGFIANRLAYAMYREALHLLESGVADAETIDRSFRNACGLWASFCGPFRWIDLTGGPALYARAMQAVMGDLSTDSELPSALRELAESDARGISNGRGFYSYSPEQAREWTERLRRQAWSMRTLQSDPSDDSERTS